MLSFKHKLVFFLMFFIFFISVIFINFQMNKMNGKAKEKSNYEGVYTENERLPQAYGEFVINSAKNTKLRMYYNNPVDIKLSLGNKIVSINTDFVKSIFKKLESLKL